MLPQVTTLSPLSSKRGVWQSSPSVSDCSVKRFEGGSRTTWPSWLDSVWCIFKRTQENIPSLAISIWRFMITQIPASEDRPILSSPALNSETVFHVGGFFQAGFGLNEPKLSPLKSGAVISLFVLLLLQDPQLHHLTVTAAKSSPWPHVQPVLHCF